MEIKNEKTIYFAEHEIYIPFNSDDEAIAFSEWWNKEGKNLFKRYLDRL